MRRFLRNLVTGLAFLTFGLSCLHYLRVRTARGMFLRTLKSLSEALAPFLTLLGAATAILALPLRAPLAVLAGGLGALLSGRYIRLVTQPHHAFEEAFGPDWQSRLAASQTYAMLARRWSWRMPAAGTEVRWERDEVYHTIKGLDEDEDIPLLCDLWRPPAGQPASGLAILYVHGGGYFSSSKDFGTRPFFSHLAAQGHLVMDIDYRLAPQADLFDMIGDVQHAIAWLKANAEWYGADPERIVLVGGSAGAHLALLSAYARNQPRLTPLDLQEADLSVRAVVSYYGIVDMAATYRRIQSFMAFGPRSRVLPENLFEQALAARAIDLAAWVRGVEPASMRAYLRDNHHLLLAGLDASMNRLLGGSPDEISEVYQAVSPLTYAGPQCPPSLFFQGEHDYLLPAEPARLLHQKLRAAGVPSVYIELPQTEHTFDLFLPTFSPPAQSALYDLDRFLALVG